MFLNASVATLAFAYASHQPPPSSNLGPFSRIDANIDTHFKFQHRLSTDTLKTIHLGSARPASGLLAYLATSTSPPTDMRVIDKKKVIEYPASSFDTTYYFSEHRCSRWSLHCAERMSYVGDELASWRSMKCDAITFTIHDF